MSLKVVESQSESPSRRVRADSPVESTAVPWFAGGLVLVGVLAVARVLLGSAWGARLASIGSPGPTLPGSLVAALLLAGAGLATRRLGGGRLAQLCAGLSVLASPVFWVLVEDWRFDGELTVGLGALQLDGPLSAALWMVGWVPAALAALLWGFGLSWLRGRDSASAGSLRESSAFTTFRWAALLWLPLLIVTLIWAKVTGTVLGDSLLVVCAVWSWGAAVLSGAGVEVFLARAASRSPLHTLMIGFLVQLVITAAWVVIGFR